jgi:sugar phosphate isomerase/epimerase
VGFLLCWGSLASAPLSDLARAAGRAGFAAISATPHHYAQWRATGSSDAQMQAVLAEAGVRVEVIDPLIRPLPGAPTANAVDHAYRHFFDYGSDEAFAAAIGLGAPTVNLAHFLGAPTTSVDELAGSLARIAASGRAHGLRLVLEFLPDSGIPTLSVARDVIAAAAAPDVSVMFDTWHFARSGGRLEDLRGLPAGTFGGLQVSDRIEPSPDAGYVIMANRLLPGDGEQDLRQIVELVRAAGTPDLQTGVEVFSSELREMPIDEAAHLLYQRTVEALGPAD